MRRTYTVLVLAVAVVFAAPAAVAANPQPLVEDSPVSLVVPVGATSCDTWCGGCISGHSAFGLEPGDGDYQRNDGWHQGCEAGECENSHGPECPAPLSTPEGPATTGPSKLDIQALIDAVRMNDGTSVSQILLRHADQVTINLSRSAIQVQGCTGVLWAHLPIPEQLAEGLRSTS